MSTALMNDPLLPQLDGKLDWWVAHVRPRCEKKLVNYCGKISVSATLPTYSNVRKYRGKEVTFHKPLFPGYVFLRMFHGRRQKVIQSQYVANMLEVPDQETFEAQLEDILYALEQKVEIHLQPTIGKGCEVRITHGALQGLDGWVEERYGMSTVLLRLNFIGQAAAVKIDADDLELI